MNKYYESLGSSEKDRYIANLEAVGLILEDNPNSKESGRIFETNMTSWSPLDYGHILALLMTLPSLHTLEQLLSWRYATPFEGLCQSSSTDP